MTSDSTSSFAVFDDFRRADDFDAKAASLRLPDALWSLCANLDQPRSPRALAFGLGGDAAVLAAALVELETLGLVQRSRRTWDEYRSETRSPEVVPFAVISETRPPFGMGRDDSPPTSMSKDPLPPRESLDTPSPSGGAPRVARVVRVSLRASPGTYTARPTPTPFNDTPAATLLGGRSSLPPQEVPPAAELAAVASEREPKAAEATPSTFDLSRPGISSPLHCANRGIDTTGGRRELPSFAAAALDRARALEGPSEETADPYASGEAFTGPRELRALIDAIVEAGGGGMPGQMLAYRVFLRVPADVVARNGIESITLVQPGHMVDDPEFIQAVDESLRSVAGLCWTRAGVTRI